MTKHPCDGHRCDNCRVCKLGLCCRRDRQDTKVEEARAGIG